MPTTKILTVFVLLTVFNPSKVCYIGIRPGMKILEINDVELNEEWGICEYINSGFGLRETIHIELADSSGGVKSYTLEKQNFASND